MWELTGIMNKKIVVVLLIVLFFTSCLASDSEYFLDYPVYSLIAEYEFFSIADNNVYIKFSRSKGYKDSKIQVLLRSNQYQRIFNIKELSYEFNDGPKGYFLKNIKSRIPGMFYIEREVDGEVNDYYYSNHYFIGKFRGEDLFKDNIKVGEKKEIKITLRYFFDDGPLKTEIYDTFIVICREHEQEDHWIWHYITPWVYW